MPLTVSSLKSISGVSSIDSATDSVLEYWISLSESIISTYDLNEDLPGYEVNINYASAKIAEFFYLSNKEEYVVQANNPFQSERIGSFAYTKIKRVEGIAQLYNTLPEIAIAILSRYASVSSGNSLSYKTIVFPEVPSEIEDGETVRNYHEYLNDYNGLDYDIYGSKYV